MYVELNATTNPATTDPAAVKITSTSEEGTQSAADTTQTANHARRFCESSRGGGDEPRRRGGSSASAVPWG